MRSLLVFWAIVGSVLAYHQGFINEDDIIHHVNTHPTKSWTAGKSTRFENFTMYDIMTMMGTVVEDEAPYDAINELSYFDVINSFPTSFDGREQWGRCIHPVRNQLQCGSCWAFGASEVLSDRFCIAGKDVILSPQYLVSCDYSNLGCHGGQLRQAWRYMSRKGVVTDKCEPYTSGDGMSGRCHRTCKNGQRPTFYKAANFYSVVTLFESRDIRVAKIKAEIYKNGPVEAAFIVYQDFMSYQSGVYRHMGGGIIGGHAVKIIGWGEERDEKYWIIANSWGKAW
eukprot:Ihof_evm7s223 gene=Ihof_evmTU7s223